MLEYSVPGSASCTNCSLSCCVTRSVPLTGCLYRCCVLLVLGGWECECGGSENSLHVLFFPGGISPQLSRGRRRSCVLQQTGLSAAGVHLTVWKTFCEWTRKCVCGQEMRERVEWGCSSLENKLNLSLGKTSCWRLCLPLEPQRMWSTLNTVLQPFSALLGISCTNLTRNFCSFTPKLNIFFSCSITLSRNQISDSFLKLFPSRFMGKYHFNLHLGSHYYFRDL